MPLTKTRLKSGCSKALRESAARCAQHSFIATYHGALAGTRYAFAARPTFALWADWIASETPIRSPATIINRISSNHTEQSEYENDHHNASQRNGKVHIDSSGLARRNLWLV